MIAISILIIHNQAKRAMNIVPKLYKPGSRLEALLPNTLRRKFMPQFPGDMKISELLIIDLLVQLSEIIKKSRGFF